jgi:hypothetical protein
MTDREKMEEVVRLDGRCEDCSKMVWKCNNCPIEKDCQDCSIQTYGRSLRLAREWLENDDMKRLIAKSGDALVKMFNACSKSKKEHEMKGKVIAEWQPVKGDMIEVSQGGNVFTKRPFYAYDEDLNNPYLTVYGNSIANWKYAREIKPKYKAYSFHEDFEMCWIGEEVTVENITCIILGIKNTGLILVYENAYNKDQKNYRAVTKTSDEMLKEDWLWKDQKTPFGKEIR